MALIRFILKFCHFIKGSGAGQCTAGHEGPIGDVSYMSIFSACFGLPTSIQLAATTWSGQIWISGLILPHFDVRTISVAWKLKKLSNIFWQKVFFLLHPLSKGVAPVDVHCTVLCTSPFVNSIVAALSLCSLCSLPNDWSVTQCEC